MPNTSNCRLQITNGPSDKWEFSGFRTEGSVWPKLEAKITECPLWIFDIWAIPAETAGNGKDNV